MSRYKFKNRKFPKEFKKVVEHIQKAKGVSVLLGNATLFNGHFTREIIIHHNYDLKNNGLYTLLRECGEVYQPPEQDNISLYQRYVREFASWDMGLQIAKELNLKIDIPKYRQEQSRVFTEKFLQKPNKNGRTF